MQVWGYINKLLRHPESNQKIVVPKSCDSWISMARYVRQYLDKIKELIGAPVLDKVALVAKIAKSLESWKMLLHGHAVSKEVSSLMRELEDLKKNLSDDDAKATKQSEEEQIMQGHRTTENNSLRSVTIMMRPWTGRNSSEKRRRGRGSVSQRSRSWREHCAWRSPISPRKRSVKQTE